MSVLLTSKQRRFIEAKDRIHCQWFERAEGSTFAIGVDSVLTSFEDDGKSYVFVNNHSLLSHMCDMYNNFYKIYDFTVHIKYYRTSAEVTNILNGNTINVFTRDFLESSKFLGHVRASCIYVDDYTMNYSKDALHLLLSKTDKQIKIAGKYE